MTAGVHAADTLARATAQQPRARILLAPVPVSPTKPLTPTHLKYLLSLDMLHRATATFADVTFVYHHTAFAGSRQVAGFWEYLDRCHPGAAHEALSEEAIGELYTAYNRAGPAPEADLLPVVRRAEAGWTHPVTARLLDIWEGHYRLLGMADPDWAAPARAGLRGRRPGSSRQPEPVHRRPGAASARLSGRHRCGAAAAGCHQPGRAGQLPALPAPPVGAAPGQPRPGGTGP